MFEEEKNAHDKHHWIVMSKAPDGHLCCSFNSLSIGRINGAKFVKRRVLLIIIKINDDEILAVLPATTLDCCDPRVEHNLAAAIFNVFVHHRHHARLQPCARSPPWLWVGVIYVCAKIMRHANKSTVQARMFNLAFFTKPCQCCHCCWS